MTHDHAAAAASLIALLGALLPQIAEATTRSVPDPYATIQEAINASVDGDEVVVAPGSYVENIDLMGKAITVRSTGGAAVTAIDGSGAPGTSVITCTSGETASTVLQGFTITGGVAESGGGLIINGSPTVIDCIFSGNVAEAPFAPEVRGGAVMVLSGSPSFTGCLFESNTVVAGEFTFEVSGGAMAVIGGSPVLHGCSFEGNTVQADGFGRGGALSIQSSGAELIDCTFTGNAIPAPSAGYGGGAAIEQAATLSGCEFHGNTASHGGGLYNGAADTSVTDCTFEANIGSNGGGLYTMGGTFSSCLIVNNQSNDGAGATTTATSPLFAGCVFAGNVGTRGGAIASVANQAHARLANCTLTHNSASEGAGIWSFAGGQATLVNCIVWANPGPDFSGPATVTWSIVEGGFAGVGNLDEDPALANPAAGDVHLLPGSPAVNAGTDDTPWLPALDFEGEPRIQQCRTDIGADESPQMGLDCNANGTADACDIESGSSLDLDGDGWPDDCEVEGDVIDDVWSGGTLRVTGDTAIFGDVSVTAGTIILAEEGATITVRSGGSLIVSGTAADPVQFNGFDGQRWGGLSLNPGSQMQLTHAWIMGTATTAIFSDGASPLIDHCVIHDVLGVAPGGSATGLKLVGAGHPVVRFSRISSVVAAPGADGLAGTDGTAGSNGANGDTLDPDGDDGTSGTGGTPGTGGSPGGEAVGIDIGASVEAELIGNRIEFIAGGDSGDGGPGGDAGGGGSGGFGVFGGIDTNGGAGGDGANGANGAAAGPGAAGGQAAGIRADAPASLECTENLVREIAGGDGGSGGGGGAGGNGGNGGGGGDGSCLFSPGPGGDGGDAGHGGAAGAAGDAGASLAISMQSASDSSVSLVNNTVTALIPSAAGLAGAAGPAGIAGNGGAGGTNNNPLCGDGADGDNGSPGTNGAPGSAAGTVVTVAVLAGAAEASTIGATNNIIALNNVPEGVGFSASAPLVIESAYTCFWQVGEIAQGPVYVGDGSFIGDPLFVDAANGDFGLAGGSPCIDAGDNTAVPEGIENDFDGNPRFVDDPDTSDAGNGVPPIVDIGALEFQLGLCPWDCGGAAPDGVVNVVDFLALLQQWEQVGTPCDFNANGVDTVDFLALLQHWGPCP